MNKQIDWNDQAEYDYETALCMAQSERYIYTVFMCHLSIEKALKGYLSKVTKSMPPKIHSLIQLTNKAKLTPPENIGKFLVSLDQASIPTRYPEDFSIIKKIYTKEKTEEILALTKETLEWLRKM